MKVNEAPLFPAGEFANPGNYDSNQKLQLIESIEDFPGQLSRTVDTLDNNQLETKFRNWTIRQIVHHLADSHVNCYVRFKWSLTEATPTIKSYDESLWSEVIDAVASPVEHSLKILQGIHGRWGQLLRRLSDADFARGFFHPELDQVVTLNDALPGYVWHGQHHLAQIEWVKKNRF